MPDVNYLYTFKYDYHHSELCKLESRQLFNTEVKDNALFSNIKVDPSISPFIRQRIELISSSEDYAELLNKIKEKNISVEGFKIEYLILSDDTTDFDERRVKLKDIGTIIKGEADYKTPSVTYTVCLLKDTWYFGILTKHNINWHDHKKKPCSFSNSIGMHIAKSLVSIASKGDITTKLLDACCGVGTIMLEACISKIDIEGCDINPKTCIRTKQNIDHFNYDSKVYCLDIKDHNKKYDTAIIDLPYNLYSYSNGSITTNIIESTAKLANRVVIVSISDIKPDIVKSGLNIIDHCIVVKRGNSKFTRNIWVCEKESQV